MRSNTLLAGPIGWGFATGMKYKSWRCRGEMQRLGKLRKPDTYNGSQGAVA